jgi:hypothetical protein
VAGAGRSSTNSPEHQGFELHARRKEATWTLNELLPHAVLNLVEECSEAFVKSAAIARDRGFVCFDPVVLGKSR